MIERIKKRNARIGTFAVAHDTYWKQFEGLFDNIMRYHKDFINLINKNEVEVIDFGMIDTSIKAYDAAEKMKGANIDILFCNMVTYATSSTFAPIIRTMDIPVILITLQPL
ncbi:MAG: L-fucose isomerase-like protein, partial [Clostridia bacterium]|nr:L-fucose isomerase-like protein [Clostridia bacterium]